MAEGRSLRIQAEAELHRDRDRAGGGYGRSDDRAKDVGPGRHRGAGALPHDLRVGAAEVEVDVVHEVAHPTDRFAHDPRIASEEL
jgi:hypothetical protein